MTTKKSKSTKKKNTDDYWVTKRELTRNIKEAYDKEGISIPFPQRDIHLFEQK